MPPLTTAGGIKTMSVRTRSSSGFNLIVTGLALPVYLGDQPLLLLGAHLPLCSLVNILLFRT